MKALRQVPASLDAIRAALRANGKRDGAVPAAPAQQPNQNIAQSYADHWIRDGALVTKALIDDAARRRNGQPDPRREENLDLIDAYIRFSYDVQRIQVTREQFQKATPNRMSYEEFIAGKHIVGEAKVSLFGYFYERPWGRPQYDGPALRALFLLRHAANFPERYPLQHKIWQIILLDLDYSAANWRRPCYDLWEEVYGLHYYTVAACAQALREAADSSNGLVVERSRQTYAAEARAATGALAAFRRTDQDGRYITPTVAPIGTQLEDYPQQLLRNKRYLDTAVILAYIDITDNQHTNTCIDVQDLALAGTVARLEAAFRAEYPINRTKNFPLFGRYPGDTYSNMNYPVGGCPWFLTTFAIAEYRYRLAKALNFSADGLMESALTHANGTHLSEQIDRNYGFCSSVDELAWSHGALLSAVATRQDW